MSESTPRSYRLKRQPEWKPWAVVVNIDLRVWCLHFKRQSPWWVVPVDWAKEGDQIQKFIILESNSSEFERNWASLENQIKGKKWKEKNENPFGKKWVYRIEIRLKTWSLSMLGDWRCPSRFSWAISPKIEIEIDLLRVFRTEILLRFH